MAKTLRESPLTTRNARAKLPEGLHWRGIDADTHLGYRRGKRGGVWLVRWRHGMGYRQEKLGTADDEIAEGTFDYAAAVRAARERVEIIRLELRAASDGEVQTVRTAIAAYIAGRDARDSGRKGRPVRSDASHKLERHVIGREARGNREAVAAMPLAEMALHDLGESELFAWRDSLPTGLKETARRRLINDLKAALNASYLEYRQKLPATLLSVIKIGLGADFRGANLADEPGELVARENQILTDETIGRIIVAARQVDGDGGMNGDLFRLILVMAATGARFSQVARLCVRDVQPDCSRLIVPASRKGRGRKAETIPVPIGLDVLEALAPAIQGRSRGDLLLTRTRYERVKGTIGWNPIGRRGWATPSEIVRPWIRIRQGAGLGSDVVPYALRHSSIVRGIRAGLPLRLVAALHDTSVAMIERHYGRWIADGLDDLAATAVIPLLQPE
jgi:integrase